MCRKIRKIWWRMWLNLLFIRWRNVAFKLLINVNSRIWILQKLSIKIIPGRWSMVQIWRWPSKMALISEAKCIILYHEFFRKDHFRCDLIYLQMTWAIKLCGAQESSINIIYLLPLLSLRWRLRQLRFCFFFHP